MPQFLYGVPEVLKNKIFSLLLLLLAPVLSGILLILAFPPYELHWLAWVALVPLLIVISGRGPKYGFLLSCVCMMVFFAVVFGFVLEVPGYGPSHHAFLDLYLGPLCAVFGLLYSFIWRRCTGTVALLAAPFSWVCIEYIRANFGFLAFPWVLLGHSQYKVLSIIQIASVVGVYGVSFLIVMVNSALAAVVLHASRKLRSEGSLVFPTISRLGAVSMAVTAALLVALSIVYGRSNVMAGPNDRAGIKVAVVQGNIPQSMKWDRRHARFIIQTYSRLTVEASKTNPALIIWPESATPGPIRLNRRLHREVKLITKKAGNYLLLGSSSHQKLKTGNGRAFSNSAFLFSPNPDARRQRYDKIRLFPFGEYLPMENSIPWAWINVPNIPSFSPGKEFTVFQGPGFRFGVIICWEILFPEMVREFVKEGAQFIVNITNEAWFGETVGPYHMVTSSVFRAVENQVYVIRCANTGISCFIDPHGHVVDRVKDESGKDIFVRGFLTERIIPMESNTIYTRYGDLFIWLSLAVTAAVLVIGVFRGSSSRYS
jgi:apolipoprotein N-acyltransferase